MVGTTNNSARIFLKPVLFWLSKESGIDRRAQFLCTEWTLQQGHP
jgi:hypothetical protein